MMSVLKKKWFSNRIYAAAAGYIVNMFIMGVWHGLTPCFDNIDHMVLLNLLSEKIKDSRFINLIGKFLKAGYMENWEYHKTYSGTPQGGL